MRRYQVLDRSSQKSSKQMTDDEIKALGVFVVREEIENIHPVIIDARNKIFSKKMGKAGTSITRNLDYHAIARRAIKKDLEEKILYDRDIDISGV